MFTVEKFGVLLFLISGLIGFSNAGCSVTVGRVSNHPPVINGFVTPLEVEYGKVDFTEMGAAITMFFWQSGNEAAIEKQTRAVSSSSNQLDHYTEERAQLAGNVERIKSDFSVSCDEFVLRRSRKDPDVILAWKEAPTDKEVAKIFRGCRGKQEELISLKDKIALDEKKASEALNVYLASVAPEDMRSVDKDGSSLEIRSATDVSLTMKDFASPGASSGVTYSTDLGDGDVHKIRAASYDPVHRLLAYEFSELDGNGNQTGLVYKFVLERANDFMGYARLKGDMKLVNAKGVSQREGSVQLQGRMH